MPTDMSTGLQLDRLIVMQFLLLLYEAQYTDRSTGLQDDRSIGPLECSFDYYCIKLNIQTGRQDYRTTGRQADRTTGRLVDSSIGMQF